MTDYYTLLGPLLRMLPPEAAHGLAISALARGLLPKQPLYSDPLLSQELLGLHFPNPIGLAAGFDKNAEVVDALLAQGFGFVEAGTVTRLPQPGNPRPRMFRLSADRAVINRLGFNNRGIDVFLNNFTRRLQGGGVAGVNIGKNKDAPDAVADYVDLLEAVYEVADYITVNISSPNTKDLRQMQEKSVLEGLLSALMQKREALKSRTGRHVPLLVKVAPDLSESEVEDVAATIILQGVEGIIVGNTTISRPDTLRDPQQKESGGLSGAPLFDLSTRVLSHFYRATKGKVVLVGVGGISNAENAYTKLRAGASLLQCYTALVYSGFSLVQNINQELNRRLKEDGATHLRQLIGIDSQ